MGISKNFDVDWFLDGRRKKPEKPFYIPEEIVVPPHVALGTNTGEKGEGGPVNV